MTNVEKYNLLATFDMAKINAELGTSFKNLGDVNEAMNESFNALSEKEKTADYNDAIMHLKIIR